ncbi:transcriptional regulator NarL [Achromatium sp. WMS2]|nr:transcriptional regulator NarL [Achromatium sp. WMS2]
MRILVIDDHALFRVGLSELLERRGINVVAAASGCEDGLTWATQTRPDVVLLDLRMPEVSGIEVLQRLRTAGQSMPVAILTTSREEQDVISAIQQGAKGYLLKDMEPDDLVAALNRVSHGETVVAPELTGVLAKAVQGKSNILSQPEGVIGELTPREREILCLVAEGQSNKVIARNLGISDGTVKLHVKAILRKLRVHSRVAAAVLAVEQSVCHRTAPRFAHAIAH